MTREELHRYRETGVEDCELSTLPVIRKLTVDPTLSRAQRLQALAQQMGNPYLFQAQGLAVKVSFSGKRTLSDALAASFHTP